MSVGNIIGSNAGYTPTPLLEVSIFGATSGWTVLGNDTINLTTDVSHVLGTASLEFDKTDGLANTKLAGVYRTVDWNWHDVMPSDKIVAAVQCSALTNVDYAFVRLGTSASHYTEWRLADSSMTAAVWSIFNVAVSGFTSQTGNGVLWDNIDYLVVGVAFDAENNALADIYWNYVGIERPLLTRT